jgi:hypothetical protein
VQVIRVIPNKGILLMCSDMYKAAVLAALPGSTSATISSIAGSLGGLTAVLLTYPLELVRTRQQYRLCGAGGERSPYASILSAIRAVHDSSGARGLYAGVGATLLGTLPFEGIKFGACTRGAGPTRPAGTRRAVPSPPPRSACSLPSLVLTVPARLTQMTSSAAACRTPPTAAPAR